MSIEERFYKIILSPHISEKAATAGEKQNGYVFEVASDATKPEIKSAVEFLFNVKVKSVRVVNVIAKAKLFKNIEGKRKGWKKAYVALQAGQTINVVGA